MFDWIRRMVRDAVIAGVNEACAELADGTAAAPAPVPLRLPSPGDGAAAPAQAPRGGRRGAQ